VRRLALAALLSVLVSAPWPAASQSLIPEWIATGAANPSDPLPPRPNAQLRREMGDRWIRLDFGGGDLVFDIWQLPPGAVAAGDPVNQILLRQLKSAPVLWDRLADKQRDILNKVEVVTTPEPNLRASAEEEGGRYRIFISSGFGLFAEQLGDLRARHEGNASGFNEEFAIMLASELDSQKGRGRWYWPPLYQWYRGLPRTPPVASPLASAHKQDALRALMLHEICHHFAGDASIDARAARGQLYVDGRLDEYRRVTQAQETEADRCAAGHLAAAGSEPASSFLFLLMMETLEAKHDADHPPVQARVTRLLDLTAGALAAAERDGVSPAQIEEYRRAFDQLDLVSVDADRLDALLRDQPRGTWPTCPLAPSRNDCAATPPSTGGDP
jgi:hypothetical protein